jgi:hypothetical protein
MWGDRRARQALWIGKHVSFAACWLAHWVADDVFSRTSSPSNISRLKSARGGKARPTKQAQEEVSSKRSPPVGAGSVTPSCAAGSNPVICSCCESRDMIPTAARGCYVPHLSGVDIDFNRL